MLHTEQQILQYGKGSSGKTTEMFTPMGFSLHHTLNRNIDLAYSFIMRSVNTDKMDGWVEVGSARDKYVLYSVTLLYKIREKFLVRTIDKMKPSNL